LALPRRFEHLLLSPFRNSTIKTAYLIWRRLDYYGYNGAVKGLRRIFVICFSALVISTTVLGLADIPQQWITWSRWISQIYKFISRDTVRDPFVVLSVLATLAMLLALASTAASRSLTGARSNRTSETLQKKPDLDAWAQVNELELWQAACLWAEKEPALPINRGAEYAHFRMLKEAVSKKELIAILNLEQSLALQARRFDPDAHTKATREELRKFAVRRNQRPRFLFPEDFQRT
jgi:hypothetical protein